MAHYTKENPFLSRITHRYLLSKEGSEKKTYHIELDILNSDITFKVGDSVGILPQNSPLLVDQILNRFSLGGNEIIQDPRKKDSLSVRNYFLNRVNFSRINSALIKALLPYFSQEKKDFFSAILQDKQGLQNYLGQFEFPDFLQEHCSNFIPLESLLPFLGPQLPRFYSISSSQDVHPETMHLTVREVTYQKGKYLRTGITSSFLCSQAEENKTPVPLYILPSRHFTLPHPSQPIIMIGPGTGVAPFRAFLQQRLHQKASGKNWLFFGEQKKAYDFYYEDFFSLCEKNQNLKLSTAFSRDQSEKVYVQDKLWKHQKSIWKWIQEGAILYVCGDAKKMAKDVEQTLLQIFCNQAHLSEEKAKEHLLQLKQEKRYLLDIY